MLAFDALHVGQRWGPHAQALDDALFQRWARVYGGDGRSATADPGMVVVAQMRAIMALIDPPSGSVHAGQRFEVLRLPGRGETVLTTIECLAKEMKRGRRWGTLCCTGSDAAGQPVYRGESVSLWGA